MHYEIIEKMFKGENPSSVLEVGCAVGGLMKDLCNDRGDLRVGGFDIHAGDIKGAKELFPKYADNFFIHDAFDPWPIPDNSYDIVFTVGFFTILERPPHTIEFAIREMLRVCKDKIILAEDHNTVENTWQTDDFCRAIRDYQKIFDGMGLSITIEQAIFDKAVIKCQKVKKN